MPFGESIKTTTKVASCFRLVIGRSVIKSTEINPQGRAGTGRGDSVPYGLRRAGLSQRKISSFGYMLHYPGDTLATKCMPLNVVQGFGSTTMCRCESIVTMTENLLSKQGRATSFVLLKYH